MDRVGILIVSKCLSASAILDTFLRSEIYAPQFYVVERQVNPFNFKRAKVHHVVADLDTREIVRFIGRHKKEIAFGLTDTEDFVTTGGRDVVERETGIPMVCVTKKYAVERSKADQRLLFEEIWPEINPRYRVFDASKQTNEDQAVSDLKRLRAEFNGLVIKPDAPARGAGVGVWGSDFRTEDKMVDFFHNVYSKGRVVVEERVEGEESSFQAFSDGRHLVCAPMTRDYKRSLDGNRGRLTGGMGSYRGPSPWLPFLAQSEWERVVHAEEQAFRKWRGRGSNPELRGIVLYDALMHTADGFKVLERNSRGGNTELINLLTTMEDDFVDVCYRMIEGSLRSIRFAKKASVVTCAVPLTYGLPGPSSEADETIDLEPAFDLQKKYGDSLRILPMDVRLQDGITYLGTSRSVAIIGMGENMEQAREASAAGVRSLGGKVRSRGDIASEADLRMSRNHLKSLRQTPTRVP